MRKCVCTYCSEEEEARGHSGRAIKHDADVVSRQLHVVGSVRDKDRGQQETDGRPQLQTQTRRKYPVITEGSLKTLFLWRYYNYSRQLNPN